MKKTIKLFSMMVFTFLIFVNTVLAAGFDISVTSKSMTVGSSVTLSVRVTDAAGKFSISSSDSSIVSVSAGSSWIDNTTQTFTLTGNKAGSAVITINAVDATGYSGGAVTGSKSITITVNPKPSGGGGGGNYTPARPKSSNNFLSSLTVDGLKLDTDFDKEKLEYTLTAPAETEKIKINAQLADSNSKVTGTGEVNVSVGKNEFEIVVTAENGSKRTYKLTVNVLELEPIKVKIGKEEYTVIRKRKDLPKISEYNTEKEITIGDEKVEGYFNEKLNYSLVGLKDSNGNIDYYIYDNGKYTKYLEYTFGGTTLQILDKSLSSGFKEANFVYDDDKITAYQEVKMDILKNTYALDDNDIIGNQFYLFYAKNLETGKENIYQYDASEKTVQRYNAEIINMYKKNSDTYYMYLLISLGIIVVLLVTFTVLLITTKKKERKPKRKLKRDFDEE